MRFLIFFLVITSYVSAQTQRQLQSDIRTLYEAFDNVDLDVVSGMLCQTGTPEETYTRLDSYFLNEKSKFRFVFTNAKFNFSPIKIIDGISYSLVSFRNVVRITYFDKETPSSERQKSLKESFAAASVHHDPARNSYLIVYNARAIASANASQPWKFAFIDATLPEELSTCILTNVKKELGL